MTQTASASPLIKRRKPWLAGLLTFVLPGLGQIYNGQLTKGLRFWLVALIAPFMIGATRLFDTFAGLGSVLVIALLFLVFILIDAVRTARRKGELALKWYNRWYLYFLLTILVSFIPTGFFKYAIMGYQSFKITGGAMSPTLRIGDNIMVSLTYYTDHKPSRGDVVVFTRREDRAIYIVKRIIAGPGDTVELRRSKLYINSAEVDEPYARYSQGGTPEGNFGPQVVPDGRVFLLGDNRDHSKDSRYWSDPFLSVADLTGKVLYIYWSWYDISRLDHVIN